MRRLVLIALTVVALSSSAAFAQTLGAVMTGSQEVPPTTTPGFGNATVTFDSTRTNITVTITVANLGAPINNFHIHEGPAGTAGPVVINLIGLGGTFTNGTMTGTFPVDAAVAQRMLQNPGNFYVNVHTTQFPGGAVRGQLAYVTGGPVAYAAELRPGNEVPANSSPSYGSAFVTIDPVNSNITWEVNTSGIVSPTLSHIHRAGAGVNGPVIINFATSASQIAGGHTHGSGPISAQQASAYLASDLTALSNPSTANGYYVNVHSTAFPGGEIRGQLVPANEYDVAVAGHVTNGVGTTFLTDLRIFNPSYTSSATALIEYFPAGGSDVNAPASKAVSISPRGTALLDDITGPGGLNAVGSIGGLRITSATQLAVTSRTYADLRASGKGTFGQFVAAQPRANGLRRGVMPQLSNTNELVSGYRTNVGFFNPNASPVTVRLELRGDGGLLIAQNTITVGAFSQQQNSIASYFPGFDLARSENLTLSFDASAPILGYAAVNDNVSTDSIFVAAQPDPGVAAN
jgi:hypothetical protein